MMSQSQSQGGRRRLTKQERATLNAPLPESYRHLSQPEVDALWRTGSEVERRRLGCEGILPRWLLVRAAGNRAGHGRTTEAARIRAIHDLLWSPGTEWSADTSEAIGRLVPQSPRPSSRTLRTIHDILWVPPDAEWDADSLDAIARVIPEGSLNRAGQIINPYPGESAGQAVFGSRRKYDDEIRQAMARAFFVSWYASEQERRAEDGLKARLAGTGEDWMDVAPNTSNAAKRHARAYAVKLSDANKGATLTDLYAAALNAGGRGPARDFGHYVAMQAMGHGVSWFDDNPEFGMEIPHGEFYQ